MRPRSATAFDCSQITKLDSATEMSRSSWSVSPTENGFVTAGPYATSAFRCGRVRSEVPAMSVDGLTGSRTVPGILLIDHESRIRSFISRALDEAGYATFCASSGEEAVRLANTGEFGLVIL